MAGKDRGLGGLWIVGGVTQPQYRIGSAPFRRCTAVAPPIRAFTRGLHLSYGTVRVDVFNWPLNPSPPLVHTGWARLFVLSRLTAMPE
jgi:hypothetical protein